MSEAASVQLNDRTVKILVLIAGGAGAIFVNRFIHGLLLSAPMVIQLDCWLCRGDELGNGFCLCHLAGLVDENPRIGRLGRYRVLSFLWSADSLFFDLLNADG